MWAGWSFISPGKFSQLSEFTNRINRFDTGNDRLFPCDIDPNNHAYYLFKTIPGIQTRLEASLKSF